MTRRSGQKYLRQFIWNLYSTSITCLFHIYNLFPACKTCCCVHLTFRQTWTTCFSNQCSVLVFTFVLLWLKHKQLVFKHTTLSNLLNLDTVFVKLILKIHNMAPNMCVTFKYSQLLWHFRTTCYRLEVWLIDWSYSPSVFALSIDYLKWRLKLFLIWRVLFLLCYRYYARWNAIICPMISICLDFLQGEGKTL